MLLLVNDTVIDISGDIDVIGDDGVGVKSVLSSLLLLNTTVSASSHAC